MTPRFFYTSLGLLPMAALAVPPGLEIHTWAEPPEIEYPVAAMAAPDGDVYVSVDKNGSLGHEQDYGSIVRAADRDGDGKADFFQPFVASVDSPRGGHFVGGTLYLIHPPYLSSYRDSDGDGVADDVKQLVKGFGWGIEHPRGADHTTNGVRMGIDGWLYVGVGDFGMPAAVGADGERYTLRGGGVIRVRPDGSEMEPYSLMTRNHFAPAISPFLDLFVRDNTNDGKGWNTRFLHFTSLGNYGYPRLYQNFSDEIIQPLADYGGGSGTGGLYLHEPGFPGNFGDMTYTSDWTTGTIHYHPMKPFEASFIAEQETFEKLPRAVGLDVDGSSKLYLVDWRNGGFSYDEGGAKVGMIHQVTAPDETPAKYTDVTKSGAAELVALVASRSGVQRLEAQREIIKRGADPAVSEGLMELISNGKLPLYARVAGIFTLKQLDGAGSTPFLIKAAEDAPIREFALRAMADRRSQAEGVPTELYATALSDPNPRVRLQALVGLARLGAKDAAPAILAAAAKWPRDSASDAEGAHHRLPHTAVQTLAVLGNEDACLQALAYPDQRWVAGMALRQMHTPAAVEGLIARLDGSQDQELRKEAFTALSRLHFTENEWDLNDWWDTRPDDRGPYYDPVEWSASAQIKQALERSFRKFPAESHAGLIEILAKNRMNVSDLNLSDLDPLVSVLEMENPDGAAVRLLESAAIDEARAWSERVSAYQALNRAPIGERSAAQIRALAAWAAANQAPAEARQAIADFVNETSRGSEVARLLELASSENDGESRIAWMSLLTVLNSPLAKPEWQDAVRVALAENPREIGLFHAIRDLELAGFDAQIDNAIQSDNEQLINAAKQARAAAASLANAEEGSEKVGDLSPLEVAKLAMTAGRDLARGEKLFTSQGCVACHSVDPAGEQKGPYLGGAGGKFSREYLIESVLDPAKVISQGFRTNVFQLNDGGALMGFVTKEEDGNITLRGITGEVSMIQRENVKEQTELPTSMMPPGLADTLSVEEFIALTDYLVSLNKGGG